MATLPEYVKIHIYGSCKSRVTPAFLMPDMGFAGIMENLPFRKDQKLALYLCEC